MKSIKILGAQLTQQAQCHEIIAWQLKLRSGKKTKCEEQTSKQLSTTTTQHRHPSTLSHGWLVPVSSPGSFHTFILPQEERWKEKKIKMTNC